jgi:hypothetical protein
MSQTKRFAELTPDELRVLPWWEPGDGKQLALRSLNPEVAKPIDGPMLTAFVQDTDGNWYRRAW